MSGWQAVAIVVAAILACIGAVVGAVLAYRASSRANDIKDRQVGREEFDTITRELRASLAEVRGDLRDEKVAHAATRDRATRAEDRIDRLAASQSAHAQWDLLVLAEVRKTTPDFPEPPPFDLVVDPTLP